MKKSIKITLWAVGALLLITAITLGIIALCGGFSAKTTEGILLSTKKADDDFTDLFRLNERNAYTLAALTITKTETVDELIEKYVLPGTKYTKLTATVDEDITNSIDGDEITVYIYGTPESFPNREELKKDRAYLLRLEPWVTEQGIVYLVSPLETVYLRVYHGDVLVHDNARSANYRKALSLPEFKTAFEKYRADNQTDVKALTKQQFQLVYDTIQSYDYTNEELAYVPSDSIRTKRLENARKALENIQ